MDFNFNEQHDPNGLNAVASLLPNLGDLSDLQPVSYTHLRAHETVLDLVCRLLLETKNNCSTT